MPESKQREVSRRRFMALTGGSAAATAALIAEDERLHVEARVLKAVEPFIA